MQPVAKPDVLKDATHLSCWGRLSDELQQSVFACLDLSGLLLARQVCKAWHQHVAQVPAHAVVRFPFRPAQLQQHLQLRLNWTSLTIQCSEKHASCEPEYLPVWQKALGSLKQLGPGITSVTVTLPWRRKIMGHLASSIPPTVTQLTVRCAGGLRSYGSQCTAHKKRKPMPGLVVAKAQGGSGLELLGCAEGLGHLSVDVVQESDLTSIASLTRLTGLSLTLRDMVSEGCEPEEEGGMRRLRLGVASLACLSSLQSLQSLAIEVEGTRQLFARDGPAVDVNVLQHAPGGAGGGGQLGSHGSGAWGSSMGGENEEWDDDRYSLMSGGTSLSRGESAGGPSLDTDIGVYLQQETDSDYPDQPPGDSGRLPLLGRRSSISSGLFVTDAGLSNPHTSEPHVCLHSGQQLLHRQHSAVASLITRGHEGIPDATGAQGAARGLVHTSSTARQGAACLSESGASDSVPAGVLTTGALRRRRSSDGGGTTMTSASSGGATEGSLQGTASEAAAAATARRPKLDAATAGRIAARLLHVHMLAAIPLSALPNLQSLEVVGCGCGPGLSAAGDTVRSGRHSGDTQGASRKRRASSDGGGTGGRLSRSSSCTRTAAVAALVPATLSALEQPGTARSGNCGAESGALLHKPSASEASEGHLLAAGGSGGGSGAVEPASAAMLTMQQPAAAIPAALQVSSLELQPTSRTHTAQVEGSAEAEGVRPASSQHPKRLSVSWAGGHSAASTSSSSSRSACSDGSDNSSEADSGRSNSSNSSQGTQSSGEQHEPGECERRQGHSAHSGGGEGGGGEGHRENGGGEGAGTSLGPEAWIPSHRLSCSGGPTSLLELPQHRATTSAAQVPVRQGGQQGTGCQPFLGQALEAIGRGAYTRQGSSSLKGEHQAAAVDQTAAQKPAIHHHVAAEGAGRIALHKPESEEQQQQLQLQALQRHDSQVHQLPLSSCDELVTLQQHHHQSMDLKHEPLGQLPASLQSVVLSCVFRQHKRGRRGRSREPSCTSGSGGPQKECTAGCTAGGQADVLQPSSVPQDELPSCVRRLAAQLAALLPFQLECCSLQAAPLPGSRRRGR